MSEQTVAGALRLEGYFDFAVLDIDLPDGNGVVLAEMLLEAEQIESAIFFTATRDRDLLSRAAHWGVVVDKTHGVDPLLVAIQRIEDSLAARHAVMANTAIPFVTHLPIYASAHRR